VTQEEKKRPINRLKSMYALRAHVDKMYDVGREAEKEGRPVAWVMLEPWSAAILSCMDVQTVFPENYGTICAASGAAATFLERSEAEGFPNHLCGYARNCLGYTAMMTEMGQIPPMAPGGGMPKPMLLVSSGAVCDARFKWFQALGRYFDAPIWVIEVTTSGPREALMEGAYEREVNFMVNELREFVTFLEKLLGKKMDWDKLEERRKQTRELNKVWWEVNHLTKAVPCPMHLRDFYSSMSAALYRSGHEAEEITRLYRGMYDEVKQRVDNKISAINYEEKYRIIFEGLPPWHSLGFFDQLAERGWNFVTERYYHPGRVAEVDLTGISDPIERYVRTRYQGLAKSIDETFEPEEAVKVKEEIMQKGFSQYIAARKVKDYKCDGAFLHTLLTCRGTTAPLRRIASHYLDVWKVPSITVEGDIVDLTLFDPADALRKAEAFEETMDHYKELRRKEGLGW